VPNTCVDPPHDQKIVALQFQPQHKKDNSTVPLAMTAGRDGKFKIWILAEERAIKGNRKNFKLVIRSDRDLFWSSPFSSVCMLVCHVNLKTPYNHCKFQYFRPLLTPCQFSSFCFDHVTITMLCHLSKFPKRALI